MTDQRVVRIFDRFLLGVLVAALLVIFYLSTKIDNWEFLTVGDDWAFLGHAEMIANSNFLVDPFAPGVYGKNFNLGSIYQAFFLKLFGASNFSWRLSNLALFVPMAVLIYLWGRKMFGAYVGLASALFLVSSHYLHNFMLIGYTNIQGLVWLLLLNFTLLRFSTAGQVSYLQTAFMGVLLGLSFYMYLGLIFSLIVWPYLLVFGSKQRWSKTSLAKLGLLLSMALIVSMRGLTDSAFWENIREAAPSQGAISSSPWKIWDKVLWNFTVFYKHSHHGHYLHGPYLDYITAVLSIIGAAVVLLKFHNRMHQLFFLLYILTCVFLGATNPYDDPPITRGFLLLPFGFMLAALGTVELLKHLYPQLKLVVALALLALVFLSNMRHSRFYFEHKHPDDRFVLLFKRIQERSIQNPSIARYYIVNRDPATGALKVPPFDLSFLNNILKKYGFTNLTIQFAEKEEETVQTGSSFALPFEGT